MSRILVAVIVGVHLAAGAVEAQSACVAVRPPGAKEFDLSRLDGLVGVFDLVLVGTIPRQYPQVITGRLELWRQDTTLVWRTLFGHLPDSVRRAQPHLGRYLGGAFEQVPPDTSQLGRQVASRDPRLPGVEWYHGVLRMGSRDVLDGTGNDLNVEWVTPNSFGGSWKADLGIAVIVDKDGPLPNPAGHFCARRRGA